MISFNINRIGYEWRKHQGKNGIYRLCCRRAGNLQSQKLCWLWKYLETHFDQCAIMSKTANKEFGQIKASRILDDFATTANKAPLSIDKTHAKNEIAHT